MPAADADKPVVESSTQLPFRSDDAGRTLATRYAHLSRYVNDVVLLLDDEGKILETNDRAADLYGYSMEELAGMPIRGLLHETELPHYAERVRGMWENGSALFECTHRHKDGSPIAVEVSHRTIESDGGRLHQSIVRDITARQRAAEELRRATRAMRMLLASNQALVRSTDEAGLFRAICGAVTATGGYALAWIGFAEDGEDKSVRIAAGAGRDATYLDSLFVTWADEPRGHGPTGTCIRSGQIAIFNDLKRDADFDPWRLKGIHYRFQSAIALPLICNSAILGAITIYAAEPAQFDDLRRSLETGERVTNDPSARSICDALLAPTPGEITFALAQRLLAGSIAVSDDEVRRAMATAFSAYKLVLEPGGAAALAAILSGKLAIAGKTVAIIASGGNVDPAVFTAALN